MMKTILAYIKSYQATILVTNRWNRSHLSWIFSKFLTFTLHTFVLTQMCPSPSPMLSRAYFGALKWLQTQINIGKGKNHTSVSRFVTRIVERSNKRSSLQRNKSQCSSLNTFGMGQNNNNVEHHTQSVTMDREKDVDAMYRKIQHRAPSCYSLKKQLTFQDTTTGSPEKWHLRNEYRNSILMMCQYLAVGYWRIISIEFLHSFLRRHFAEEPVVPSWNVGCSIWPVTIPPSSATPLTSPVLCS